MDAGSESGMTESSAALVLHSTERKPSEYEKPAAPRRLWTHGRITAMCDAAQEMV
jgi:hypothetical protein